MTTLDLKRMPDEEFSILVTPSVPKTVMCVKVEENGNALLCSKAAERLAKIPRSTSIQQRLHRHPALCCRQRKQRNIPQKRQKNNAKCREAPRGTQGPFSGGFSWGVLRRNQQMERRTPVKPYDVILANYPQHQEEIDQLPRKYDAVFA